VLRELAELPFLPSPDSVIRTALTLAELKPGELFVDLGCGDGRVLIIAVKEFGAQAVGVELNPLLVRLALREVRLAGVYGLASIIHGDLFSFNVEPFDVIYCYPSPSVTRRLELKLISECKEGCRIILHDHPLPSVKPLVSVTLPSGSVHLHKLYLYVAGRSWTPSEPAGGRGLRRKRLSG